MRTTSVVPRKGISGKGGEYAWHFHRSLGRHVGSILQGDPPFGHCNTAQEDIWQSGVIHPVVFAKDVVKVFLDGFPQGPGLEVAMAKAPSSDELWCGRDAVIGRKGNPNVPEADGPVNVLEEAGQLPVGPQSHICDLRAVRAVSMSDGVVGGESYRQNIYTRPLAELFLPHGLARESEFDF